MWQSKTQFVFLILVVVATSGCQSQQPKDPDRMVIESLLGHGSDLSKPHTIDFFFDFPELSSAKEVCEILATQGFEPHVTSVEDNHTCRAVRKMIPKLEVIQNMTERFETLAYDYDGNYDGWGTEVEY